MSSTRESDFGKITLQEGFFEVPMPTKEDLIRAAYARALDDDEPGEIRLEALELCLRWMGES